jgi:menaquinol-cytochrome c reductase cytochrome b subunit
MSPRAVRPRLPSPPLASALRPAPKRPGAPKQGPAAVAADAGAHVVDWVDERTSLSGGLRWLLFRKVPRGTNWFYTLG